MRYGLLQIATGITKCDDYYNLQQYTVSFVLLSLNISIFLEGNTKSPIMALSKTYYCQLENFENHRFNHGELKELRWKAERTRAKKWISTARATNPSVKGIKDIPIMLLCNK